MDIDLMNKVWAIRYAGVLRVSEIAAKLDIGTNHVHEALRYPNVDEIVGARRLAFDTIRRKRVPGDRKSVTWLQTKGYVDATLRLTPMGTVMDRQLAAKEKKHAKQLSYRELVARRKTPGRAVRLRRSGITRQLAIRSLARC